MKITTEDYDINGLNKSEKNELLKKLYPTQCKIFNSFKQNKTIKFDKNDFLKYVISPDRKNQTYLRVFYDGNDVIGYHAVHIYPIVIDKEEYRIFKAQAGLLQKYRGKVNVQNFLSKYFLMERVLHPLTTMYYFGTMVHPSSYMALAKYFEELYPHPLLRMSKKVLSVMEFLSQEFHVKPDNGKYPYMVPVGWVTTQSVKSCNMNNNIFGNYFLQHNPNFQNEGTGLLMLIPITFPNLFLAIWHNIIGTKTTSYEKNPIVIKNKKLENAITNDNFPETSGKKHIFKKGNKNYADSSIVNDRHPSSSNFFSNSIKTSKIENENPNKNIPDEPDGDEIKADVFTPFLSK